MTDKTIEMTVHHVAPRGDWRLFFTTDEDGDPYIVQMAPEFVQTMFNDSLNSLTIPFKALKRAQDVKGLMCKIIWVNTQNS